MITMETPRKFYENFMKAKKFPTGTKIKKDNGLLKGKNQQLVAVPLIEGKGSRSSTSNSTIAPRLRRRSCCGR